MKNRIMLLIVMLLAMWQGAVAQGDNDTVWTRDLWQLGSTINQVQFTPDGKNLFVAIGNGVSVFDVKTGIQMKRFGITKPENNNECNSFAFTEEGSKLITSHNDTSIIVWDWDKVDTLKVFHNIGIQQIKLYESNTIMGVSLNWELDNKTYLYFFDILNGVVIKKQFINDGESFAISKTNNLLTLINYNNTTHSRNIELWELSALQKITTLGSLNASINDLSFSFDGKYLASASSDGIIKIWDIQDMKLIKELTHLSMKDGYLHVKFSPNAGYLISSGGIFPEGFSTKIWTVGLFSPIYQYETLYTTTTSNIDISLDSTKIALGRSQLLFILNSNWTKTGIIEPNITCQTLFPNPSGNEITLPAEQNLKIKSILISNSKGEHVKKFHEIKPGLSDIKIDISPLLPGLYFISVEYLNKISTFKFEKSR